MAGDGVEVGTAYVSLLISGDKVGPGIRRAMGQAEPDADRAGRRAGAAFSRSFGRMAATLGGAYGLAKGVSLLQDSAKEASDLAESVNAVNVTFGKSARGIRRLGEDAAQSLGLSRTEFNSLAVRFSSFASTVAGKGGDVTRTMDDLTTRAADFASVMNLEVAEAAELFQSGLAGETEPLRRYGLDLSAAKVQAYAYANGIAKSGEELTESQKVQARYMALMEQTKKTQGDFANTSDGLANSQRRLSAQWKNAKADLGEALLPALTDVSNYMSDEAVPAISKFIDQMKSGKGPGGEFAAFMGDAADFTKATAKNVGDVVSAFNSMPDWAKASLGVGAVGLYAGNKVRKGLGGGPVGGGLLSKGSTPVNPLFVSVVNGGVGAGGGAGGGKGPIGMAKFGAAAGLAAAGGVRTYEQGSKYGPLGGAALDSALAKLAKSNPKEALRGLRMEADGANLSLGAMALLMPKTAAALDATGNKISTADVKTLNFTGSLDKAARGVSRLRGGVEALTPSVAALDRALDAAAQTRTARLRIAVESGGYGHPGLQAGDGPLAAQRRGTTVNVYGDIRPNDYNDVHREFRRRSTQREMGGD